MYTGVNISFLSVVLKTRNKYIYITPPYKYSAVWESSGRPIDNFYVKSSWSKDNFSFNRIRHAMVWLILPGWEMSMGLKENFVYIQKCNVQWGLCNIQLTSITLKEIDVKSAH